jgi:oligoribonuclease NrnB/cAMP/cGMP phosphodiesterase (DHH superfamily)
MVIDHHKTAQEQLKDFPGAIFNMAHSGAYLAWRYFHEAIEVPQLIRYVEDRDMWWWKLPYSREVSAALWSYPMEFHVWDIISNDLESNIAGILKEGTAILRYMKQQTEMICNQAYWCYLGEYRIPVVNATSLWSEVCEELLSLYPEAPFVGCYHQIPHGEETIYKWSLRSKGEFDVSAVARQFGGGGHKNAAGFVQ